LINNKNKLNTSPQTISNWLNEHDDVCTFSKIRKESIKLYSPKNIIHKQTLNHIQPYTFKYHKAKIYLLFHDIKYNNQFHNIAHFYEPLKKYLEKINSKEFPHHIFTYEKTKTSSPNAEIAQKILINDTINNQGNIGMGQNEKASASATEVAQKNLTYENTASNNNSTSVTEQRASQIKFSHLKINHIQKKNQANQLAKLAINLAATNKDRHQAIQDFMLINDSTTIAVEVPIYLTNWDAGYYKNQKGFIFPLNNYQTPITGHVDILQVRNGLIHILDYKPEADKQNPTEQLTIYALALSRKLNLPIYYFKCAWFDENNYFEFFPLHAVYERKKPKIS